MQEGELRSRVARPVPFKADLLEMTRDLNEAAAALMRLPPRRRAAMTRVVVQPDRRSSSRLIRADTFFAKQNCLAVQTPVSQAHQARRERRARQGDGRTPRQLGH